MILHTSQARSQCKTCHPLEEVAKTLEKDIKDPYLSQRVEVHKNPIKPHDRIRINDRLAHIYNHPKSLWHESGRRRGSTRIIYVHGTAKHKLSNSQI